MDLWVLIVNPNYLVEYCVRTGKSQFDLVSKRNGSRETFLDIGDAKKVGPDQARPPFNADSR